MADPTALTPTADAARRAAEPVAPQPQVATPAQHAGAQAGAGASNAHAETQAASKTPAQTKTDEAAADSAFMAELDMRLKSTATPELIGYYLANHADAKQHDAIMLAINKARGAAFAAKTSEIWQGTEKGAGSLSGSMLVSNNPEGLMSPGKIVTADAVKGKLAAYVHHSNHTKTPLDLYLVVKPQGKADESFTAQLSGAAAADKGTRTAKASKGEKASSLWASDPNVVVAAANTSREEKDDPNAGLVTTATLKGAKPAPFKLGQIPKAPATGDAPLFDARYDVELSADAEIDVVAEAAAPTGGGEAEAAEGEARMADGNTKYQMDGSSGRAAGMYEGADFTDDADVVVSKLPHSTELTGGKVSPAASPKLASAGMPTVVPDADVIEKAIKTNAKSLDKAAVEILDKAFRIAPQWLTEKGVWDGSTLTANGLSGDYVKIIEGTLKAVKADAAAEGGGAKNTLALINAHPTVSADGDYASYGTMFELGYMIHNDSKAAAKVGMTFVTDTEFKPDDGAEAAVYRGIVNVDGTDHPIANDHSKGHPAASAPLGGAIPLAPDASKYVAVQFQSPGQISGGQRLDIKKQG